MKIDEEIKNIDDVIFEHIERNQNYDRGYMSQDILTRLRNLIEHTALKILINIKNTELDINYKNIQMALKYIKGIAKYKFLCDFHRFVQNSVGHYTPTNENAERLMLKYYEYLIKLKRVYKTNYKMQILRNIDKFPLDTDDTYYEYYGEIAKKIDSVPIVYNKKFKSGRYYIQKVKPFFINNNIYYEITLSLATDNMNKFDRVTMYTKCEINTNYSINISIVKLNAKIFGEQTTIQIINNWEVSIRSCEINNLYMLEGENIGYKSNYKEYKNLMSFLTQTGYNLLDIVDLEDNDYNRVKQIITDNEEINIYIFNMLDIFRYIIKNELDGANVIRYLLYNCNNRVIKQQQQLEENNTLSNLCICNKSIPFERMPFAMSLRGHNPTFYDLLKCFDVQNRKDELLARYVKNNTEKNGCLYTNIEEVKKFGNIEKLVNEYNSKLYLMHQDMRLIIENDYIYMNKYEEETLKIIRKLQELSKEGVKGYEKSVKNWMEEQDYNIDDENKRKILENLFTNSKVALIYGAAGTGKTTLLNHISRYYNNENKIYLANTYSAVENLKRRVTAQNCEFYTVKKAKYNKRECDILIIDECSTVCNEDMIRILENIDFKLIILVGDTYQIESIMFGNWFSIAKMLINENAKHELQKPYRSKNENLTTLWNKVRNLDDDIIECLAHNKYSQRLDKSILKIQDDDEIILCLNYDGLYGINNINRFMQNSNPNKAVDWGINTYKVGDPILFNESIRFSPVIYNNMKGKIVNIKLEERKIWFDIEIDTVIDEIEAQSVGLILLDNKDYKKSTVRFYVNKFMSVDEDDDQNSEQVVPFEISYAVSIHKSQGLEYNSVKIIISQEIEEKISHNILYTAITRARKKLKIYWTPECEKRIISGIKTIFNAKDTSIIRSKLK